jgi:hypothetical protein
MWGVGGGRWKGDEGKMETRKPMIRSGEIFSELRKKQAKR